MSLIAIYDFPGYSVSQYGEVFSFKPRNGRGSLVSGPRKLKKSLVSGYERVGLYREGVLYRNCMVHRLVAEAFIPNPLGLPEVNHKNGIKIDNFYTNLEWVTKQKNMEHSRSVLRRCTGENHGRAKLNNEQVIFICKSAESSSYLAKELAVHQTTVSRIRKQQGWKHDKITEWQSPS